MKMNHGEKREYIKKLWKLSPFLDMFQEILLILSFLREKNTDNFNEE